MPIEFSLKLVYILPGVGKSFKFMVLTFLENALDLSIFTMSLLTLSSPPSSCQHTIARRKLLIPPGSFFSKICFPQQEKKVEETMICFVKIQSKNMKMTYQSWKCTGMINKEVLSQFIHKPA